MTRNFYIAWAKGTFRVGFTGVATPRDGSPCWTEGHGAAPLFSTRVEEMRAYRTRKEAEAVIKEWGMKSGLVVSESYFRSQA